MQILLWLEVNLLHFCRGGGSRGFKATTRPSETPPELAVGKSSKTPASEVRVRKLPISGNSWINAHSLVDFSASGSSADWQESTNVLSPFGSGAVAAGSRSGYFSNAQPSAGVGSGTFASPSASLASVQSPGSAGCGQFRRSRYYASPPEAASPAGGTVMSGDRGRAKPPPVVDGLKQLGIDYLDDQYIINLRRVLGTYLMDSMKRFEFAMLLRELYC